MAAKTKKYVGQQIIDKLLEIERSQRWLSEKIGEKHHSNFYYFLKTPTSRPNPERLKKINSILNTDFKQ